MPTELLDTRTIEAPVVVSAVALWDVFDILSEDDLSPEQEKFIALNAELSLEWPVINQMKESLPDADEWAGKPNKLELLER